MSCLNGEIASTNFGNPQFVRLSVPELGFGSALDAMVQFCLERGEELRTGCFITRTDHRVWIYFCFPDPKNAKDFAERFSGELFVPAADDFSFLWQGARQDIL
jgi:hypothetical protein